MGARVALERVPCSTLSMVVTSRPLDRAGRVRRALESNTVSVESHIQGTSWLEVGDNANIFWNGERRASLGNIPSLSDTTV